MNNEIKLSIEVDKNYGINTKEIIDSLYSIGIRVVFIKTEECIDGLPTIELRATYLKKEGDINNGNI